MSDDTQIAKMGQSLPKTNQPQQPIQANLNQYGNESTQIAYVQHYDATTNQTVLIMQGESSQKMPRLAITIPAETLSS